MADDPVLLIGSGDLAEEVRQALDALERDIVRMPEPTEREMVAAFDRGPIARAVIVGEDAFVLRMALMVRQIDEDVGLLITLFDQTTAEQVGAQIDNVTITSMADIVAPALAAPCLDESLGAVRVTGDGPVGLRSEDDRVVEEPVDVPRRSRVRALLRALLTP